jgi:two-component system OmpR family response regulator
MDSRTSEVPGGHVMNHRRPALRVLVVEDHEDTAASLAVLLRLYGHNVEVVPDGSSALRAVQAESPDVVLLDLGLPKMDGWRLAKRIREQSKAKRPFLIAVTGYGRQIDHDRSQEAGIDLHLIKPVDPIILEQILRRFQTVIAPSMEPSC